MAEQIDREFENRQNKNEGMAPRTELNTVDLLIGSVAAGNRRTRQNDVMGSLVRLDGQALPKEFGNLLIECHRNEKNENRMQGDKPAREKEVQASSARASDAKASDTKASDTKAGDAKAGDAKAGDAKAGDTKAGDAKASDAKAGDTKASDAKASDAKAGDTKAGDTKAGDTPASKGASDGGPDYTRSTTFRVNRDDPSTLVTIEKDTSGRNIRVTDANGAVSRYESNGTSDSPEGNVIVNGIIHGKNHRGEVVNCGEIAGGRLRWTDAAGQEHNDRIRQAVLTPGGDLNIAFEDGSRRIYHASGARVDFDDKGRPSSMVDANGNIFKYENYSIPGIGFNAVFGGPEFPERITAYNPASGKSYEFRREAQLGSAEPYYKVYVDGLPLSGEMSLSAQISANLGGASPGLCVSFPIDKTCQVWVQPDGAIKIRNEKPGMIYNDVSVITRKPDGASTMETWRRETTTCIWWGYHTQNLLRNGMPANVSSVPR